MDRKRDVGQVEYIMISWNSSLQAKDVTLSRNHKIAPRRTVLKISHEHETHTLHLWSSDFRLRRPLRIPTNMREQLYILSPSTNRKSISTSAEHVALRCGPQIASQLTEKNNVLPRCVIHSSASAVSRSAGLSPGGARLNTTCT